MEQRYKFNVLQEQKAYLEQVLEEYDDQAAKKLPHHLESAFWVEAQRRSMSVISSFLVKGTVAYAIFGLISISCVHFMLGINLLDPTMIVAHISYFNGSLCLLSIVALAMLPALQKYYQYGVLCSFGMGIFVTVVALFSVEHLSVRWQGSIIIVLVYVQAFILPSLKPQRVFIVGCIASTAALIVLWFTGAVVDLWVYFVALYISNGVMYGIAEMVVTKDRISFIRAQIIQVDQKINEVLAEHLLQLSQEDDLTHLANRRNFDETYERLYIDSIQQDSSFGVLFIDIDFFKKYNDHYGHQQGDVALASVASMIKKSIRYDDFVARYGGEEFVVLLPRTDESGVLSVANNIVKNVVEMNLPHEASQCAHHVTVSVGGAVLTPRQDSTNISLEQLLHNADAALYMAKKLGRNRVYVHQSQDCSILMEDVHMSNQGI